MACNNCEDYPNREVTGGFVSQMVEGEGFTSFADALGASLGGDDDILWELAASGVAMDPTEPLETWENKVRVRFAYLKENVNAG